jgi:hypothetical protein
MNLQIGRQSIRSNSFVLGAGLILFSFPAGATTLARMGLDQLAGAADAVARVRCVRAESRWENGSIWTVTSFDVVETMKGSTPARILVRLPGGHVGHLTAIVDGTPIFRAGDDAVIFLERSGAGGFSISGWVQGTFRIDRDPQTGNETVTQDSSSFAVFDSATRTFRAEGVHRMPIAQFRQTLATAIGRTQGRTR